MSIHILSVVSRHHAADDHARLQRTDTAVQLSLFDVRPTNRIVCLPVAELHGATFARFFAGTRPSAVVDLRSHPHFDMVSLTRSATFELFRDARCDYLHLPIDLRPPFDQAARWTLRARTWEVLATLATTQTDAGRIYAFLVNRHRDVSVLETAVRQPEGHRGVFWNIEDSPGGITGPGIKA